MAGAQQACREVVGRKLECTSEPGGGSNPVSDEVLGSAIERGGLSQVYLDQLSDGNLPCAPDDGVCCHLHENRPGSM